MPSEALRYA